MLSEVKTLFWSLLDITLEVLPKQKITAGIVSAERAGGMHLNVKKEVAWWNRRELFPESCSASD